MQQRHKLAKLLL